MKFATVEQAIKDFKIGKFVIIVDDEKRENEGDLVVAAEKTTRDQIAFMIRHTSGVLCVPILGERLDALKVPMMHHTLDPHFQTPFALSVDAKGSTTGISASDRLQTIRILVNPKSKPDDLFSPGHMFPLRAHVNGVLGRPGHTEATVDLANFSGLYPAGVLGELILESGEMARLPQLIAFGKKHDIKLITINQLINYQKFKNKKKAKTQPVNNIVMTAHAKLPTRYGMFTIQTIKDIKNYNTHLVLTHGKVTSCKPVLVRIHSACTTSEIFGSLRCDCKNQIDMAMKMIVEEGSGIVIYLYQEGRGIGLTNKIKAYELQDSGMDTVEANKHLGFDEDVRDYIIAADVLRKLGVRDIKLLTNNPDKINQLRKYSIGITKRIPLPGRVTKYNKKYLETKREKLGHLI